MCTSYNKKILALKNLVVSFYFLVFEERTITIDILYEV